MLPQNLNIFKITTIAISLLIGVVALLIFSGKFPGIANPASKNKTKPALIVWGTIPKSVFDNALQLMNQQTGQIVSLNYTDYSRQDLANALAAAAATGGAPDLVLTDTDVMNTVASLLYVIPYSYMDELTYKNIYIDASHMYATPLGVQSYPVLADPLITFYNKKILRENGFTNPPRNWIELPKYQDKLTIRNVNQTPERSAFGIGANNVVNNKEILTTSLMQLGHNPVRLTYYNNQQGGLSQNYFIDFGLNANTENDNMESDFFKILRFQTAFSDPHKSTYTWSEIGSSDYDMFVSGRSAIYFGKASDYNRIVNDSPNLELGIANIPQLSNNFNITTGDITGVGVLSGTKDFPYAVEIAQTISGSIFSGILAESMGMSSARKDVLAGNSGTEKATVVGGSAVIMQKYYNINFKAFDGLIFRLYDDILSGRKSVEKAVESFMFDINKLYFKEQ